MGMLVDGKWSTKWYGSDEKGHFVREATKFHGKVTRDGSSGHRAEGGRYHLYVSYACPWAHRTLILRKLRGLEEAISVSVVNPYMGEDGWSFEPAEGSTDDPILGARFLRDVYLAANADYTGRVTVPVLWDRAEATIVNNESREIIRMLDDEFADVAKGTHHLHPMELHDQIEHVIDDIYEPINNGVYRAGFATKQEAYDEAVDTLFAALDRYDAHLATSRYLCGDALTEADVCLFTTLVRFDSVYNCHFKCNVKRIIDYPNLWGFLRDVYQIDGVAETVRLDHIKRHYYTSHQSINPPRIIARGPALDFRAPHGRERIGL